MTGVSWHFRSMVSKGEKSNKWNLQSTHLRLFFLALQLKIIHLGRQIMTTDLLAMHSKRKCHFLKRSVHTKNMLFSTPLAANEEHCMRLRGKQTRGASFNHTKKLFVLPFKRWSLGWQHSCILATLKHGNLGCKAKHISLLDHHDIAFRQATLVVASQKG